MSISAVSASPATAAASTASTASSKYTAIVDQYARTLAPGSTASFDEQFEAFSGLMRLAWGSDGNGVL